MLGITTLLRTLVAVTTSKLIGKSATSGRFGNVFVAEVNNRGSLSSRNLARFNFD